MKSRQRPALTWRQRVIARRELFGFSLLHTGVFALYMLVASCARGLVSPTYILPVKFCMGLLCCLFLCTAIQLAYDAGGLRRGLLFSMRPLIWLMLIASAMVGFRFGAYQYDRNMREFFEYKNMRWYDNVSPSQPAASLFDGKVLRFTPRSYISVDHVGSYVTDGGDKMCVAPIVDDSLILQNYEPYFWAVGENCCVSGAASGGGGVFTCSDVAGKRGQVAIVSHTRDDDGDAAFSNGDADKQSAISAAISDVVARAGLPATNTKDVFQVRWVADATPESNELFNSFVLFVAGSTGSYFASTVFVLGLMTALHRNARDKFLP